MQRCLDRAFEIMWGRTGLKQGTANTSKKALKPMNRQVLVFKLFSQGLWPFLFRGRYQAVRYDVMAIRLYMMFYLLHFGGKSKNYLFAPGNLVPTFFGRKKF